VTGAAEFFDLPLRRPFTIRKEFMATYASFVDWQAFDPASTSVEADVEPFLIKAERDIDSAIGKRGSYITERRIDPTLFTPWRRDMLAMACCAQAQYRMFKGEEFFASVRPMRQSSREGAMEGQEPYIGPIASQHLAQGGFYNLVRGSGKQPYLYDLPNQNTGS